MCDLNSSEEISQKKNKKFRRLRVLGILSALLVVTIAFRSTVWEPFRIPSGSMLPTIVIGDFILVNKMAYGLKVPFSDTFSKPIYLWKNSPPKRGDIIVFKYPKPPGSAIIQKNYIKRIVGLPGETIQIKNKHIYINGRPLPKNDYDGSELKMELGAKFKDKNFRYFTVEMATKKHLMQVDIDNYFTMNSPLKKIPKGMYYVMGDNRDYSSDSRFWGFVPFENIKGRAMFVWFSFANNCRWNRIGQWLN